MFLKPTKNSSINECSQYSPCVRRKKIETNSHRRAISHDIAFQGFFLSNAQKRTIIQSSLDLDSVLIK